MTDTLQGPAPAPAEGEVAEIVDHIRAELQGFHPRHRVFGEMTVARLSRTADLLELLAAPVPVPSPGRKAKTTQPQ